MPLIKFWLNQTYGLGGDVVWRISRWPPSERKDFSNSESLCHCGVPIKFWLNPTYGLGGDVIWRISRWRPWPPSWISEQYNCSNSESLCCSDASHQVLAQSYLRLASLNLYNSPASHQVSAQSDLLFGIRCHLKNFKMAVMVAILDSWTERI